MYAGFAPLAASAGVGPTAWGSIPGGIGAGAPPTSATRGFGGAPGDERPYAKLFTLVLSRAESSALVTAAAMAAAHGHSLTACWESSECRATAHGHCCLTAC